MRLLHCADIHLDSRFSANLPKEKAKERKNELLAGFSRLLKFAAENCCDGVIIAGDLYDKKVVTKTTRKYVLEEIRKYPEIPVYYLKGNHDEASGEDEEDLPANLRLFTDSRGGYVSYNAGTAAGRTVKISGAEITKENEKTINTLLLPDPGDINIVVLHGQDSTYKAKDKAGTIALRELAGKGIDYLALGHIHEYKSGRLDARGTWCYSGCLEGRGFDECGEKGAVIVEVNDRTGEVSHKFMAFPGRRLWEVKTDISGCESTAQICEKVRERLAEENIASQDSVKIVLTGNVPFDTETDTGLIEKTFEEDYYFVRAKDESGLRVDFETYRNDKSLKGEFIRRTEAAEGLTEEEKAAVIRYGLQALRGEETK